MRTIFTAVLSAFFCATAVFAGPAGFADNGNGTVTDITTNLMWQQCSAGLSGTSCATGTAATYAWENAISFCESLSLGGFTDWRLPKIKELQSIVDLTTTSGAINATYFPNTPNTISSNYWSSTDYAFYTFNAWFESFFNGVTSADVKTVANHVRCVRGGR